MEKKRSVVIRRIILVICLGFSISVFAECCGSKEAISQEERESDRKALKEWEQEYGITADEYWQSRLKFHREQKEYERRVNQLVRKHFGEEFEGVEDAGKKGVVPTKAYLREVQSIKPPEMPEQFMVSPSPPGGPPEWFTEETMSEYKQSSN